MLVSIYSVISMPKVTWYSTRTVGFLEPFFLEKRKWGGKAKLVEQGCVKIRKHNGQRLLVGTVNVSLAGTLALLKPAAFPSPHTSSAL